MMNMTNYLPATVIKEAKMITREYIIDTCISQGMTDGMIACYKAQVYAIIVTADGRVFGGTNYIANCDVDQCPRAPNEKYEKCKTVCHQPFHGETSAIDNMNRAGATGIGARVYITGHWMCCDGCRAAMKAAGVVYARSVDDKGEEYFF